MSRPFNHKLSHKNRYNSKNQRYPKSYWSPKTKYQSVYAPSLLEAQMPRKRDRNDSCQPCLDQIFDSEVNLSLVKMQKIYKCENNSIGETCSVGVCPNLMNGFGWRYAESISSLATILADHWSSKVTNCLGMVKSATEFRLWAQESWSEYFIRSFAFRLLQCDVPLSIGGIITLLLDNASWPWSLWV